MELQTDDIDDPFSYRARDGFMGIGPLWANNDDGTVYMQGHVVIPNPWSNVSTNGDTTTDDTTDKDGGDEEGNCGGGGNCKVGEKLWLYFAGLPGLLDEGMYSLLTFVMSLS